jgi:hypothetical protein
MPDLPSDGVTSRASCLVYGQASLIDAWPSRRRRSRDSQVSGYRTVLVERLPKEAPERKMLVRGGGSPDSLGQDSPARRPIRMLHRPKSGGRKLQSVD